MGEGDEIMKVNHRILLKNFMQILREEVRMTPKTGLNALKELPLTEVEPAGGEGLTGREFGSSTLDHLWMG